MVCLCVRPSVVVLFCCIEKKHLNPTTFSLDWLFSRCFCLSPTELCIHSLPPSPVCVCPLDWLKAQALCVAAAAAAVVCRWEWSINNGVRGRQMCSVLYCSVLLDRSVCKELCTLYFFHSLCRSPHSVCVAPAGDLPFSASEWTSRYSLVFVEHTHTHFRFVETLWDAEKAK